ncbi:MAG: hypothetical protein WA062_13610, partial [Rhodoferax sp.]
MFLRPKHPPPRPTPARRPSPLACVMALSLGLLLGGCANLNIDETPDADAFQGLTETIWWRD